MKVHRIDHVGVIVNDLPAAKAFFLDLGLELQGEGSLEGAWLDRIVGLNDVKTSFAFFRVPDGQTSQANIEIIKYHTPSDENGIQQSLANANANTLGIRHIAFAVEDIEARVPFRELLPGSKKKGRKPSVRYTTLKAGISSATFVGRRASFSSWPSRSAKAKRGLWNRRAYWRWPLSTLGAPTAVAPLSIRSTRA
jgi:catechol 2,3-dioxygenase-like lactoylglutathione lyase family enzyme